MSYPHSQIHRSVRGTCCGTLFRLPDVLRLFMVSGRVLVLFALHGVHVGGIRVHCRLPSKLQCFVPLVNREQELS
jgi:hypothetical protein